MYRLKGVLTHGVSPQPPGAAVPAPGNPAPGHCHLSGPAASGGHDRGVRHPAHHHRRGHRPQPGRAGAADPGLPGDVRRVHFPPALPHREAVRLRPAGDPGRQLCLRPQYAGHRSLRRRGGGHCRRHDRGRHRGGTGGGVRQEDPPAVPAGDHRHGGVHHRPLPLPHRHQLHGRRHRQHL